MHSIEEGIQARVKDPMWFLGRQWQTGEFRAQNGGRPIRTEIKYRVRLINHIRRKHDAVKTSFNEKEPLEKVIEQEEIDGSAKGWDPNHLEYSFHVSEGGSEKTKLIADEYDGSYLDWFNFRIAENNDLTETENPITTLPTNISYTGMPNPRWFSFEDKKINIGNIKRQHLNYLTMPLVEFALLYSNDWFYIAIDHEVGKIRQITGFKVTDSFGFETEIKPVIDPTDNRSGLEAFTLAHEETSLLETTIPIEELMSKGSFFYMPNNLQNGALESEPIEEISFARDELANMVFAIEHKYQKNTGEVINRHDEEQIPKEEPPVYYFDKENKDLVERREFEGIENEPGENFIGPLAKYDLMSYVPPHWVPYIAKQISNDGGSFDGQIILRRARTQTDPSKIQYKGVLLGESKYVYEEEITRTGVILKRVKQLARDGDGNLCSWQSRKKYPDMKRKSSNLRFDYIREKREE
ncbi:MAG: hypothetical protein ACTSR1_09985 [Candidatus Heimdallarchaeota archaeon]